MTEGMSFLDTLLAQRMYDELRIANTVSLVHVCERHLLTSDLCKIRLDQISLSSIISILE